MQQNIKELLTVASFIKLNLQQRIFAKPVWNRFHLEDETLEVAEIHDVNSGRYKAPLFLKRSKIPKVREKFVRKKKIRRTLLTPIRF